MSNQEDNKSTCLECGAKNSLKYDKKEISINDKLGSYKTLVFDFCEECGHVSNFDLE